MSGAAGAPVLVHLMRHGRPTNPGRLLGHTDDAATAEGIAACVAQAADLSPTGVISSDLHRAERCAAAIAAAQGATATVDVRWRELDFGAWDGCDPRSLDAAALGRFWADPDGSPPPGGERWSALKVRVGAALADLSDRTLVVSHAGAMRAALAQACDLSARQAWAFDLPYAALVTLRLWRGELPAAQIVRLRP